MVVRPLRHTRLPLAVSLAALLLTTLVLAAALAAAPASAATSEDYFFISSIGRYYGASNQFDFGLSGAGPNGIAVDANDNVYVTLPSGFAKFTASGRLLTRYVGQTGWYTPSVGGYGIEADSNGRVYFADSNANRVVKLVPDDGNGLNSTLFTMVNMYGVNNGDGTAGKGAGQFTFPTDCAVEGHYLYVADRNNNRIQKFDTATGDNTISWVASWGANGGDGTAGGGEVQFNHPQSLTVVNGEVYVVDTGNHRIQVLTTAGAFVRAFGTGSSGNPLYLSDPIDVDVDAVGDVYVTDLAMHRVNKYRLVSGAYELVTRFGSQGTADNQFTFPWGCAVASNGYLYVTDTQNNKIKKLARDATPPTVTALRVPSGWVKTIDWWELRASDPTVAGEYTSNGVNISYSKTGGAPWSDYLEPFVSLDFVEGDNTVTYYATDAVGNASTPASVHVYWDKTAPVTSASGVAGGWSTTAQTVTLTPDNDGRSPVASTQYRLQGAADWTTYTAPFPVSAEGEKVYEFRSSDSAGNVETVKTVTVRNDMTGPSVTFSGIPDGWTNQPVSWSIDAKDALAGVQTCMTSTGADYWVESREGQVSTEGLTTLQVRASDNAGNVTETAKAIRIDRGKPVPTALARKSVRRGKTVKLPFKVSDLTPQARITIKVYKGARLKATLKPGLKTTNVSLSYSYKCKLAKGKYTWKVYATDLAGNTQARPGAKTLTVK